MNNYIEIITIVEGKTEEIFINALLSPYLSKKNIFMCATQISKPGQKGGDVRFKRMKNDIEIHLKQSSDTYITTFIDYYGVKEWPGLELLPQQATSEQISKIVNGATKEEVIKLFPNQNAKHRFIPYMAIHEFESLLFSDSIKLSKELGINEREVNDILKEFGSPESINNSPQTAPSKRLDAWSKKGKFPKTTTGITIAIDIGIESMRVKCPLFDTWLKELEQIVTCVKKEKE